MKTISKIAAATLVAAFVVVGASSAKAATVAELQAMIAQLTAQIAALSGTTAPAASVTFTSNLTVGSTGAEVSALQDFLAKKGFLTATARGYFGALTKAAVAAYQTSKGITPAAGYFGPATRAAVNAEAAVAAPSTGTTTTTTTSTSLSGGDGDFKSFKEIGSVGNETVDEGKSENVLGFKFEANDSDLKVERVKVNFASSTLHSDTAVKPWKYLDTIALYNGDKKVASVDASDKDNWNDLDADGYQVVFNGLNEVVKDGATGEFYVNVTANDSIDDNDLPIKWSVVVDSNAVRALNAAGIDVYNDKVVSTTFTLDTNNASTLDLTAKTSDNEDATVSVEDTTTTTNGVTLYKASAESKDGDSNITKVTVDLATSSGTTSLDRIVKTVYLYVDGKEVGRESGDTSVSFDDLDINLSEDDKTDVVVKADIFGTDKGNKFTSGNGVKVTNLSIEYTDSQDDDQTKAISTDGGAIGFYTQGVNVALSGTPTATATYGSFSGDNDRGVFTISFKVTAFGDEDLYILGANTTASSNAGVVYALTSTSSVNVTKAELTSTADDEANTFVVSAGDTETFTFTVDVQDASTTAADVAEKLTISGIKWSKNSDGSNPTTFTDNLKDFKTPSITI